MERAIETFVTQNPREAAVVRALRRAYAEGIHGKLTGMHSDLFGASAWSGAIASGYRVEIDQHSVRCSCKAGQVGMVCKHAVGLADRVGMMDLLIPDFYARAFPSPVAVTIVELVPCPDCHGDGYTRMYTGGRMSDWIPFDCHSCAKSGLVALELVAA